MLTVGADDVVAMKYVTLGQVFNGERVIKSGLQEDDRVIVNGLMRARTGPEGDAGDRGAAEPVAGAAPKSKAN